MLAIYLHHIRKGVDPNYDGDSDAPDADDLKRRRKNMQRGRLPHVVAEQAGEVVGYAYAVPFRKRPAYRYTVKHSIYVRNDRLGRGIGRMLLAALVDACAAGGYRQMIGYIDGANEASLQAAQVVRLPRGRTAAVGRLQVRPLDQLGDDAALARPRRHRAAGAVRRELAGAEARPTPQ